MRAKFVPLFNMQLKIVLSFGPQIMMKDAEEVPGIIASKGGVKYQGNVIFAYRNREG